VVGCSVTRGFGLNLENRDPRLWVNQLLNTVFDNPNINNLSVTGKNNHWIFTEVACEIAKNHYDIILVAWTELVRFNYSVGLELYNTDTMLKNRDIDINPGINITGSWLNEIGDRLRKIYNDHWALLDLVKYVNILVNQVNKKKSKIYFINALTTLPNGYFQQKDLLHPADLSKFEKQMLHVATRDDAEIHELYNLIHQQYKKYGGICEEHWLNLYSSLNDKAIDTVAADDLHPGYKSQLVFAEYLIPILRNKLNER
jgi:hypothetical protein